MPDGDGAQSRRGERRMAALGIEPELIDEPVAAAVAGMGLDRFRAECRIPAVAIGRQRLLPLDEVRAWAKAFWRRKTGGRPANDEVDEDARDWLDTLPGGEGETDAR